MEQAPNGSRWYAWGKHYEVTEQTTRDGEPAVRLKLTRDARQTGDKRRKGRVVITRLLVRHGLPST